ncbi:hypothetical protein F5B20DRAFT_529110 [Whalleya microplaca]|nr:hypothetical protein F5B20DRAFT_529110 [Whalleya microplaca]
MGSSPLKILARAALTVFLVVFVITSLASASSPPSESPSVETELICHTDNPAECYPKVFSATEEFQVVHDDQDLPIGLHVQLDVQTGQKKAKLYDPKEENPALEGLPVDRAVVTVDSEAPRDEPQVPPGAPAYEPVGIVKEPREKNEDFTQALDTVKEYLGPNSSGQSDSFNQALEILEDLSHDMYYGVQITQDTEALQALFCLLTSRNVAQTEATPLTERPDFVASLILASSIRNNKPALQVVEDSWDSVMSKQCKSGSQSLKSDLYNNLEPQSEPASVGESTESDFVRLNLAVLDGLLKSPKIRNEFLENDGMKNFLRILLRSENVWESRKAKVARIVSDIFLDEDVGASLGVWPSKGSSDDSICAKGEPESLEEGCWEYHLKKISGSTQDAADWSEPLLAMLKQRRPSTPRSRDEL